MDNTIHRESYELYIPKEKEKYPSRFKEGYIPHNKGKKWNEWLPKEEQEKALKRLNRKGNAKNIAGINKIPIIGYKDGQIIGFYSSSIEAGKLLGITARNIRSCCVGERKTAGGFTWRYDTIKIKLQNKQLKN